MSLREYIKETRAEMRHVSWPTRRQAIAFTALVVTLSLLVGAMLGLFDYIFSFFLKLFI